MGAQPEHPHSDQPQRHEPVTWIGRERHTQAVPPGVTEPAAPEAATPATPGPVLPEAVPFPWPDVVRRNPRGTIAVAIVLLLLIAALTARHFLQPSPLTGANAQDSDLPLVSVITPGVRPVQSTVTFTGTIHARYDMPISPEGESGRVTAVLVEAGDHVKRGQVLARLDQSVLMPQVNRLQASLEEAKAQAALSEAEYRRAQGVEAAGALSAEEIARRHAAAVTDEAKVKVAAAQLAEAQARLGKTEILAPASGIVLTRSAEVGQTASPGGEPLFRLAADGEMEMWGQVAERDLAALSVKQTAQVHVTGIDDAFEGHVRLLGAIIDPQTRLGEIRISLPENARIRPGAFARAEVLTGTAKRPVLPQTAVLSDSDGTYVLIVNADGKTERRAVTVGNTVAEGLVISDGLTGNERVISTAGAFLRAGEKVKVTEAQQPSAA